MYLRLLACLIMLSLAACATTIGNKNDVSKAEFTIQKTSKNEVARFLGLPSKISKNEEEGKEYWYYTKGAKLSGVQVWSPSGGVHDTTTLSTGAQKSDLDYSAMFVFDQNQKLIEIQK